MNLGFGEQRTSKQGGRRVNGRCSKHDLNKVLEKQRIQQQQGKAYQQYCYMCRTYGTMCNTQWVCQACGMPLCKKGRRGIDNGCIKVHFNPQQPNDWCYDHPRDGFIVQKGSIKKNPRVDQRTSTNVEGNDRMGQEVKNWNWKK